MWTRGTQETKIMITIREERAIYFANGVGNKHAAFFWTPLDTVYRTNCKSTRNLQTSQKAVSNYEQLLIIQKMIERRTKSHLLVTLSSSNWQVGFPNRLFPRLVLK